MNHRAHHFSVRGYGQPADSSPRVSVLGESTVKSVLSCVLLVLTLAATSFAEDLPEAPSHGLKLDNQFMIRAAAPVIKPNRAEAPVVDKKFVTLAVVATAATFADSYTTLFARQNYLAGKTGVCNMEVESAWLYGTHPTVGRTYAVASLKSASSVLAAYYLRKHHHNKLWSLPLLFTTGSSMQGVAQNLHACN